MTILQVVLETAFADNFFAVTSKPSTRIFCGHMPQSGSHGECHASGWFENKGSAELQRQVSEDATKAAPWHSHSIVQLYRKSNLCLAQDGTETKDSQSWMQHFQDQYEQDSGQDRSMPQFGVRRQTPRQNLHQVSADFSFETRNKVHHQAQKNVPSNH